MKIDAGCEVVTPLAWFFQITPQGTKLLEMVQPLVEGMDSIGDRFRSDEFLRLFDFPLPRATIAKRPVSIVPQQFLFLMNSQFMINRAKALMSRLHNEAKTDGERIERAYRLLYGRPPREQEKALGLEFLAGKDVQARLSPWEQYAQVLLSANEFMHIR